MTANVLLPGQTFFYEIYHYWILCFAGFRRGQVQYCDALCHRNLQEGFGKHYRVRGHRNLQTVHFGKHYRVCCHRNLQVSIGEHWRVRCHRNWQVGIGEHYRVSCHRDLHSRSALESTAGSDLTAFLLTSDTAVLSHSSKLLLTPFLYFCLLWATLALAFTGTLDAVLDFMLILLLTSS